MFLFPKKLILNTIYNFSFITLYKSLALCKGRESNIFATLVYIIQYCSINNMKAHLLKKDCSKQIFIKIIIILIHSLIWRQYLHLMECCDVLFARVMVTRRRRFRVCTLPGEQLFDNIWVDCFSSQTISLVVDEIWF